MPAGGPTIVWYLEILEPDGLLAVVLCRTGRPAAACGALIDTLGGVPGTLGLPRLVPVNGCRHHPSFFHSSSVRAEFTAHRSHPSSLSFVRAKETQKTSGDRRGRNGGLALSKAIEETFASTLRSMCRIISRIACPVLRVCATRVVACVGGPPQFGSLSLSIR